MHYYGPCECCGEMAPERVEAIQGIDEYYYLCTSCYMLDCPVCYAETEDFALLQSAKNYNQRREEENGKAQS